MNFPKIFGVDWVRQSYREETYSPRSLVAALRARIAGDTNFPAWIHVLSDEELEPIFRRLESIDPDSLPLWGIPFAIKDNIDLAGIPTTAACPEFAYVPDASATAVQWLLEAGAIPLGKTNLDQFATGLVGTRSPYGAVPNPWAPDRVAGGSSSGSAAALALGHVAFALGTDTAGSGRVPAAFCQLIGVKATKGLVSTRGVVPACRSLDCVTVFAHSLMDAMEVTRQVARFDAADPFSRQAEPGFAHARRIVLPLADQTPFFGDQSYAPLWKQSISDLPGYSPWQVTEADFTPLFAAARLLYQGPWIAERYSGLKTFVDAHPQALHPVTRTILQGGEKVSGSDVFTGWESLAALRRAAEPLLTRGNVLILPTAGNCPTLLEVEAEPILRNTELGTYTNFINLLDLCALAIPCGTTPAGVPFGITLIADRFCENPGPADFAKTTAGRAGAKLCPPRRHAAPVNLERRGETSSRTRCRAWGMRRPGRRGRTAALLPGPNFRDRELLRLGEIG
jgi:allophanate hydrolase